MKQYQLQQVKFPKAYNPHVQSEPNLSPEQQNKKPQGHSQMIRIIIALLIAIFIYNQSQQTTINYNEIIKNQKMFLVKNIRGVLPTLSGNIQQLKNKWQVVHFQNFHQNHSEIFINYTFNFTQEQLIVQNIYCNIKLTYDWKNYSYNIDLKPTVGSINDQLKEISESPLNQQNINQTPNKEQINSKDRTIKSDEIKKITANIVDLLNLEQKKKECEKNKVLFTDSIVYTSVWTISQNNLYLLLENAHLQDDYYLILQPVIA